MKRTFAGMACIALLGVAAAAYAADDRNAARLPRHDKQFIDKAMNDNRVEEQLAKIAEQRAASDGVKQFAHRLRADHTRAGEELQRIAGNLGYTPTTTAKEARESRRFEKLSGDKFDREFAKAMVKDHERAVKLFQKEAQDGENQALWQFAQKTLPTLEAHLQMARELAGEEKRGRKGKRS